MTLSWIYRDLLKGLFASILYSFRTLIFGTEDTPTKSDFYDSLLIYHYNALFSINDSPSL